MVELRGKPLVGLVAHAPAGLRWAIAGRDAGKLAALRERLPGGAGIGVLRADGASRSTKAQVRGHFR